MNRLIDLLVDIFKDGTDDEWLDEWVADVMQDEQIADLYERRANKVLAENPDDPMGNLGLALAGYMRNKPNMWWNFDLLRKIARTVSPLIEALEKNDPETEVDAEMDGLIGTHMEITVTSNADGELWLSGAENILFADAVAAADECGIATINPNRFQIHLTFKNVLKPVKPK